MRRRNAKITNPMTPIGPVPFVGRQQELAERKQHLAVVSLVSLHGPLGSGKTRLVSERAPTLGVPCTSIDCYPGDRASALRSRAERALRCVPGTLSQTLAQQARVLVIDAIQHLRIDEATSLLSPLLLGPTALGRIMVVGRDPLAAAVGANIAEIELLGLDIDSASALWNHLEESTGEAEGWDAAFSRTRGVPLGLRREYARARFGAGAWEISQLEPPARAAIQALAILRQPVAPAAAAELVASTGATSTGPRLAWQAGDDGALGSMDQITRVREVCWHWLASGDRDRAADVLLADRELSARSGGAGEFEALLDALGDRPRPKRMTGGHVAETGQAQIVAVPLDAERSRALAALRIEIAVRGGRYTEAFERAAASPGAVSPLLHAELTRASRDVAGARRALQSLIGSPDPSERARAVAMLAERELLAGKPETAIAHLGSLGDIANAEPLARARLAPPR